MSFEGDYAKSLIFYEDHIVPILLDTLEVRDFALLDRSHDGEDLLDKYGCVDAVALIGGALYGIELRVQWDTNYASFSLRKRRATGAPTEWAKLNHLMSPEQADAIKPAYTFQAFAFEDGKGRCLEWGLAETRALIDWVWSHKDKVAIKETWADSNEFIAIPFDDLTLEPWFKRGTRRL